MFIMSLIFKTLEAVVAFAKAIDFPVEASELYKDGGLYHMTILLDLQIIRHTMRI